MSYQWFKKNDSVGDGVESYLVLTISFIDSWFTGAWWWDQH